MSRPDTLEASLAKEKIGPAPGEANALLVACQYRETRNWSNRLAVHSLRLSLRTRNFLRADTTLAPEAPEAELAARWAMDSLIRLSMVLALLAAWGMGACNASPGASFNH